MDTRLDRDSIFLLGVTIGSFLPKKLPLTRKAVAFASKCHKGDRRDNNEPYISHPLAACNTLIILGVHDDWILAAELLHDVVEHGHTDLETVKREFGQKVAGLVDNQTKRPGEEPEQYYARVGSDIGSILGKGADRLHNITNMIDIFNLERLKIYVEETEKYVITMLKSARYEYLEYANALVLLYESIKNIIKITKKYIEAIEVHA